MTKNNTKFNKIEDIVADIGAGKIVIIVDDENRENEGDLVAAGALTTDKTINFMAKHGRGLICAPISANVAERFGLRSMIASQHNRDRFHTNYKISIDSAQGVSTGISAADRAHTINLLAQATGRPADFVSPGHIFPLGAMKGGALRRAGHTEAAVDLCKLSGLPEVGVICEIMKDDGKMARLPDLLKFAKKHKLKIASIKDLIAYRYKREKLVRCLQTIKLPTSHGEFDMRLYRSAIDDHDHIALTKGNIARANKGEGVLARVHSECLTGDVFGSRRCDCGSQLDKALRMIEAEGVGALLYLRQEGRGIGLEAKLRAYKLQEEGLDTVEANQKLGFAPDLRDYGVGAQILADIGARRLRLMTNNPRKLVGLAGYGIEIVERVPIKITANAHNRRYLSSKKIKLGHKL